MIVDLAGGVSYVLPAGLGQAAGHFAEVSPAPSTTAPFENEDTGTGSGAGSIAFLVIVILIVVSVLLFWAMNTSLKRARRNLGGDPFPHRAGRRPRPTIPTEPPNEQGSGTSV